MVALGGMVALWGRKTSGERKREKRGDDRVTLCRGVEA
jgi:hypothetical protein